MNHVGPAHLFGERAEKLERYRLRRDSPAVANFESFAVRVWRLRRRVQLPSRSVRVRSQHPNRRSRARQMPGELIHRLDQSAITPRWREKRTYVQDPDRARVFV